LDAAKPIHSNDRQKWFPNKYFKIKKNTAYAEYRNYIPELIEL
jgi:hypothetical protein